MGPSIMKRRSNANVKVFVVESYGLEAWMAAQPRASIAEAPELEVIAPSDATI